MRIVTDGALLSVDFDLTNALKKIDHSSIFYVVEIDGKLGYGGL